MPTTTARHRHENPLDALRQGNLHSFIHRQSLSIFVWDWVVVVVHLCVVALAWTNMCDNWFLFCLPLVAALPDAELVCEQSRQRKPNQWQIVRCVRIGRSHYRLHEVGPIETKISAIGIDALQPILITRSPSLCLCVVSYVPHLPVAGETLRATKFQYGFGGKGANQCVAAAKLGSSTALISKVIKKRFFPFRFL